MDPPREDGRRCLAADELAAANLALDGGDRWRLIPSPKQLASLARLAQKRTTNSLDAIEQVGATTSLGTAA
jgi:hypothetical protein